MISVSNRLGEQTVRIGIVRALRVACAKRPPLLHSHIDALIDERGRGLAPAQEKVRKAVRDMLRIGSYKPTGRGKPASEYLLRAAGDSFPEISPPVDTANFISLKSLLPVSIWDVDRAGASAYCFRLGKEGERYVFNDAGQEIEVKDLIVGCAVPVPDVDPDGYPIVNPVKDSMATKLTASTTHLAAAVYAPVTRDVPVHEFTRLLEEFAAMLQECGDEAETCTGIIDPGETRMI